MSATNVALTLPEEVLDRIDQHGAATGESRSEYMLSWLPAFYGDDRGAQPPSPAVTAAPTTKTSISVPDDVIRRIDATATRQGISRAEYIRRWQPGSFASRHRTGA